MKSQIKRKAGQKLSGQEQRLVKSAKKKIKAINKNMLTSKGLTLAEAVAAAKVGLINPEQRYWWLENWQKGERKAELDEREGRFSGPFETADEFIAHLSQCKTVT